MIKKAREDHERYKHAPWVIHKGKPFRKGSILKWTDKTTSRWETLKENVFGESLQLHEDYVLDDILNSERPVLLSYHHPWNYVVEVLLVLLLLAGIFCGFRERLLWMCLLGILPDALMHIGLGFAINEIYIMSAHWIYIFPIAFAYLLKANCQKLTANRQRLIANSLRTLIALLTVYLLIHNIALIVEWSQQSPVSIAFWFD